MAIDTRKATGIKGEEEAARFLTRCGYAILEKNVRTRVGEIDLVAKEGKTLVFVEVKTRDGSAFGLGAEAVTAVKQRRMTQLALDYMTRHHLTHVPCRFDVVSIRFDAGGPAIEIVQNAFDAATT